MSGHSQSMGRGNTRCPRCKYDLRATAPQGSHVTCPECGRRFTLLELDTARPGFVKPVVCWCSAFVPLLLVILVLAPIRGQSARPFGRADDGLIAILSLLSLLLIVVHAGVNAYLLCRWQRFPSNRWITATFGLLLLTMALDGVAWILFQESVGMLR